MSFISVAFTRRVGAERRRAIAASIASCVATVVFESSPTESHARTERKKRDERRVITGRDETLTDRLSTGQPASQSMASRSVSSAAARPTTQSYRDGGDAVLRSTKTRIPASMRRAPIPRRSGHTSGRPAVHRGFDYAAHPHRAPSRSSYVSEAAAGYRRRPPPFVAAILRIFSMRSDVVGEGLPGKPRRMGVTVK